MTVKITFARWKLNTKLPSKDNIDPSTILAFLWVTNTSPGKYSAFISATRHCTGILTNLITLYTCYDCWSKGFGSEIQSSKSAFQTQNPISVAFGNYFRKCFWHESSISGSTKLPNFEKLFRMKHRKMFSYFKERSNLFQNSYWNI